MHTHLISLQPLIVCLYYQAGVEMIWRDLLTGHWKPYLEHAISLKPCYEGGINGGEVAAYILQETATVRNYGSDNVITIELLFLNPRCPDDFEILHGDLHGLSDTVSFLKSLSEIVSEAGRDPEKRQMRERKAAAGLFNWEEEIFVTRAPGRLDVMGGIADYPGSLVLQVSYGSELSNRGPTFNMDLSDFMDGGKPISYEKAKEFFVCDPSQKWAAYVAGAILVLMTEVGVCFKDSISLLVSSADPEGKGVSSSASIEVENHIVGAPCGVMDQMTSACGEADELLAMVCQPAEVIGLVEIPSHVRFWGIDSGIRHSIGGVDYGSVRIGAMFMGRRMMESTASTMLSGTLSNGNGTNQDELEEDGLELLESEASLDYMQPVTSQVSFKYMLRNFGRHLCLM
ncbi:hypothetical protein NL676_034707 [Syzygium grande]|nr:hypothetical protein NL676_034707 [Syzygium grande]